MAGSTSVPLVAAVSNAGGLGTLGIARAPAEQIPRDIGALRNATEGPFGVNFLLFMAREPAIEAALAARPPVFSAAWARADQDLRALFSRAHEAGSQVMYMVGTVPEARRAKAAGADVIVAQGTEGGGHVGWMATMAVLPMIVDAVAPLPVLAAGGIADGRGLAAALALGAQGALLGTRFLATQEAPLHPNFKQAVLDSNGHDTVLTEIPDIARANVWPGAMARARRNGFIERWAGREWELRARQPEGCRGPGNGSRDRRRGQRLSAHRAGCRVDPRPPARRRDRGTHRGRGGGAAEGSLAQAGAGELTSPQTW